LQRKERCTTRIQIQSDNLTDGGAINANYANVSNPNASLECDGK